MSNTRLTPEELSRLTNIQLAERMENKNYWDLLEVDEAMHRIRYVESWNDIPILLFILFTFLSALRLLTLYRKYDILSIWDLSLARFSLRLLLRNLPVRQSAR